MSTVIRKCESCKDTPAAQYQNEHYGWGKRVKNTTNNGWRCTVCGKEELKLKTTITKTIKEN